MADLDVLATDLDAAVNELAGAAGIKPAPARRARVRA
jgi:hypothetical protein